MYPITYVGQNVSGRRIFGGRNPSMSKIPRPVEEINQAGTFEFGALGTFW